MKEEHCLWGGGGVVSFQWTCFQLNCERKASIHLCVFLFQKTMIEVLNPARMFTFIYAFTSRWSIYLKNVSEPVFASNVIQTAKCYSFLNSLRWYWMDFFENKIPALFFVFLMNFTPLDFNVGHQIGTSSTKYFFAWLQWKKKNQNPLLHINKSSRRPLLIFSCRNNKFNLKS